MFIGKMIGKLGSRDFKVGKVKVRTADWEKLAPLLENAAVNLDLQRFGYHNGNLTHNMVSTFQFLSKIMNYSANNFRWPRSFFSPFSSFISN